MILKLKRTPGIFLVGFMGAGKTTLGRLLAERLGWTFVDLDDVIEAAEGIPIAEIFEQRGEREFRRIETEALREAARAISRGKPAVVALGGGAFAQPQNTDVIANHGVSIWLDVPLELAWQRVSKETGRPLARNRAQFCALYEARREAYARAEYRVEAADDDAEAMVAVMLGLAAFGE